MQQRTLLLDEKIREPSTGAYRQTFARFLQGPDSFQARWPLPFIEVMCAIVPQLTFGLPTGLLGKQASLSQILYYRLSALTIPSASVTPSGPDRSARCF